MQVQTLNFKGIVYITHFDTDDDLKGSNEYVGRDQQRSWVKMNLNFMTQRGSAPRDLNINDAFKVVMRYDFGSLGFMYDAKIDGYDDYYGTRDAVPSNSYDCSLIREPSSKLHRKHMRENKYADWWHVAHFTGERGVVVGYRTESGILKSCKAIETDELMRDGPFVPAAVVGCTYKFLTKLCDEVVRKECHVGQYLLRYEPSWYGAIKVAEIKPDSEYCVLPQWFIDGMTHKKEQEAPVTVQKTEEEVKKDVIESVNAGFALLKVKSEQETPSATEKEPAEL